MERGWLGGMNGDGERISGRRVGGIFPYNGLQIWTRRVNSARHGAKLGLDRLTVGESSLARPCGPRASRKAARSVSGDEIRIEGNTRRRLEKMIVGHASGGEGGEGQEGVGGNWGRGGGGEKERKR